MKHDFIKSREWKSIASELTRQISIKSIAALTESKTFEEMRYSAGYVDALRDILNLPEIFLKDDESESNVKDTDEVDGTLTLANKPLPIRKLTSFR